MTYTASYDKTTHILTFTGTTNLDYLDELENTRYYLTLYQEGVPGSGYNKIKDGEPVDSIFGTPTVDFTVTADGIFRFKLGYTVEHDVYETVVLVPGYIDENDEEVAPVTEEVLAYVQILETALADDAYFHMETTAAASRVIKAFMAFVKEKVNRGLKLKEYRRAFKMFHEANIAYTQHNYIEADTNIKLI